MAEKQVYNAVPQQAQVVQPPTYHQATQIQQQCEGESNNYNSNYYPSAEPMEVNQFIMQTEPLPIPQNQIIQNQQGRQYIQVVQPKQQHESHPHVQMQYIHPITQPKPHIVYIQPQPQQTLHTIPIQSQQHQQQKGITTQQTKSNTVIVQSVNPTAVHVDDDATCMFFNDCE